MRFVTALLYLLIAGDAHAQFRWTETGGGSDYVGLQAPAALTGNFNWILPATDGSPNQCLSTNGAGTFQWFSAPSASSLSASDGTPAIALSVDASGNVGIGTTSPSAGAILDIVGIGTSASAIILPRDTTANRSSSTSDGIIRYNTTTNKFEGRQKSAWTSIASGFMGKLDWAGAGNCWWLNAAGTSFANIAADTDCPAPTVTGGATAPGTRVPAIIINNLPAGTYEVTATSQFYSFAGSVCRWRLSDGTSASGITVGVNGDGSESYVTGVFTYAAAGTRTFTIQSVETGGTAGLCYVANDEPGISELEMWVKRLN